MARSTVTLTFSVTTEEARDIDFLAEVLTDGSRSELVRKGIQRLSKEVSKARFAEAAAVLSSRREALGLTREDIRRTVKELVRAAVAENEAKQAAARPKLPPSTAADGQMAI